MSWTNKLIIRVVCVYNHMTRPLSSSMVGDLRVGGSPPPGERIVDGGDSPNTNKM